MYREPPLAEQLGFPTRPAALPRALSLRGKRFSLLVVCSPSLKKRALLPLGEHVFYVPDQLLVSLP